MAIITFLQLDISVESTQVLILVLTRDLAQQIQQVVHEHQKPWRRW